MKIIAKIILLSTLNIYSLVAFADLDFIDKTVIDLIQDKIGDSHITIEHVFNSKTQVDKVRAQQDKIQTMNLEQLDPKLSNFKIIVNYNDKTNDILSGHYISYLMMPIAARLIKYGDIIKDSDLIFKKIMLDKVSNGYLTDATELVGMQAKKFIASGNMFKSSDIVSPNVIKNGDPVNIVYTTGSINLKTSGISMGSGAVGDMIKVKNSTSGAVLLGQIINKNTVKIGGDNE